MFTVSFKLNTSTLPQTNYYHRVTTTVQWQTTLLPLLFFIWLSTNLGCSNITQTQTTPPLQSQSDENILSNKTQKIDINRRKHYSNGTIAKRSQHYAPKTYCHFHGSVSCQQSQETVNPITKKFSHTPKKLTTNITRSNDSLALTTVTESLWPRIRKGYGLKLQFANNSRIKIQRDQYVKNKKYLLKAVDRASNYLFYIVNEAEQRNLPLELTLLPFVESAFDPFAYSRSHASGLWQFIASTGKVYGLKQNWWYDGRRDLIASTQAALSYLQTLHEQFQGDWLLALAAYNCGATTVKNAIKKNRRLRKKIDYWNLPLPKETRQYVPRLIAVSQIFYSPKRYNIQLPVIANSPTFIIEQTYGQIDLNVAATMANMDFDKLHFFNPGFNRRITDPEGPHRLLIPINYSDRFREKIKTLPPGKRVAWQYYYVQPGDNLWKIAKQFNTTPSVIKQVNHLMSAHMIKPRQQLLIPSYHQQKKLTTKLAYKSYPNYSSNVYNSRSLKQNKNSSFRTNNSSNRSNSSIRVGYSQNGVKKSVYRVQTGDSLWKIAQQHQVSVQHLIKWNHLTDQTLIKPGMQLVIWHKGIFSIPRSSQEYKSQTIHNQQNQKQLSWQDKKNDLRIFNYHVRHGDSLSQIASAFNVSVTQLSNWNQIDNHHLIQPGQKLVIFVTNQKP